MEGVGKMQVRDKVVHVQTRSDRAGHRNALGMDKSMEMGEWWEREERNRDVEKRMRGDEMANGDKE